MPLLKTKALPVSDVPNCESWVNGNLHRHSARGSGWRRVHVFLAGALGPEIRQLVRDCGTARKPPACDARLRCQLFHAYIRQREVYDHLTPKQLGPA
jgi:hypothetical protein